MTRSVIVNGTTGAGSPSKRESRGGFRSAYALLWTGACLDIFSPQSVTAAPPNIVFIMADDHGRQAISAYGSKLIRTPNIDRLASEGLRFTAAMANNSICSPSRAVLLTGKYNHLCGVRRLEDPFDGSQQTFPKLLQQAGYQTAIVGKWHLATEPTGFDYFSVLPGHGRYMDSPFKTSGNPWGKGGEIRQGYVTDVITDVSLDWLKNRDPKKPFCLMIHHKAPHGPHDPASRHENLFKDVILPEPATLLDDYAGRAPEPVAKALTWSRLVQADYPEYKEIRKQFTGDRVRDTRLMYQAFTKGYLRLVAALDENIGRVLDYLDQNNLADNTIVVYTSDNGFFLGEHGFYNKMWMYEPGFHIPLIVRMPGNLTALPAGSTNDQLVGMFDMAPTLLDLAGIKVPADIQGQSLKPLLAGEKTPWRNDFYYHYYGVKGSTTENVQKNWIKGNQIIGVTTKAEKLVFYPTMNGAPFWEYFDLVNDPEELNNRIGDPACQAKVAAMKQKLRDRAEFYKDDEVVKLLTP